MAVIIAKNGQLLTTGPATGKLATTCRGTQEFNCSSPSFSGCAACSCCGASKYLVCISGATGAAAALNNPAGGWLLSGGGGSYSKTVGTASVTLTLSGEGHDWLGNPIDCGCRNWHLVGKVGGTTYLDASGNYDDWTELSISGCSKSGSSPQIGGTNNISFSLRPASIWSPPKIRLTLSGNSPCASSCADAHPYHYFTYRGGGSLDGVYEIPLASIDQYGTCTYGPITGGSYWIDIYSGANCTGTRYQQSGQFTILAWINSSSGFGASAFQNHCPHPSAAPDFRGYTDPLPNPLPNCKNATVGFPHQDDPRCPLCYGYANAAFARVLSGGSATMTGIYT